ncbi:MAG: AMP-binding protein, partial [Deltaproteobacteria bacterium]|nr:AMP-binding protein [Deltaproteobacteria bacterium]
MNNKPLYNNKPIHQIIERQANKTPNNTAVIFNDNKISYKELNEQANRLARFLIKQGINNESIIAIMNRRSIDTVIQALAILKTGGAYLPINPDFPKDRIFYMLKNSNAKIIITDKDSCKKIPFTLLRNFEKDNRVEILVAKQREHIKNINDLPMPNRELIDLNKYKNKIGMASMTNCISIQTTRGCPYNCLYCHKLWSKNHVYRSADNIYDEINYYYKKGVTNFSVIDDCFNLNKKNSSQLFRLIIKNRLKIQLFFPNGLRGDSLPPDYIDLMVEAGARGINLSLETASLRLQKLIKKNLNLEKFKETINYIAKQHPNVILEMAAMHGFPSETEEEAMMTLNFIKSIKWLHFPYIHILKIFPNTEMEKFALKHGISKEDILLSRDKAFHELPETLPFSKSFTRNFQASFMNDYFLSKKRLEKVLPIQMKIFSEKALVQKYNAYLPVEIKNIKDIIKFVKLDNFNYEFTTEEDQKINTYFDKKPNLKKTLQTDIKSVSKKILLLDLSTHFTSHKILYNVVEQPLGLIFLATYIKKVFGKSIDIKIYKSGVDFDSFEELQIFLNQYRPDLIGIRTLTFFREFFHQTVSLIKLWGFNAPIVTGGPYASSEYDTILKDRNIDIVIIGEGELTFAELIDNMLKNNFNIPPVKILQQINGIAFRDNSDLPDNSLNVIDYNLISNVLTNENRYNFEQNIPNNNLAYVIYTSGSTGKPKGVMIEHKQVNNCIGWMQEEFNLNQNNIVAQRTNLTFDPSVWEIFWPLYIGGSVRIISEQTSKSPTLLIDTLHNNNGLTVMYCPATLLKAMAYILNKTEHKPNLKLPSYFEGKIINTYGPTECAINNTYYYVDKKDKFDFIPIGKPIKNNQIYILNENMEPASFGIDGEIYITGDSVGRGYINDKKNSRKSFISNPFGNGKIYKTGDIGKRLVTQDILLTGRNDNQLKIRGNRVEISEIEKALL